MDKREELVRPGMMCACLAFWLNCGTGMKPLLFDLRMDLSGNVTAGPSSTTTLSSKSSSNSLI